ncbi:hypothetical protein BGW36DRAFT_393148 [Talaromyces proteolyticus]|uniref:Asl1-like glycosyl hydrolase catalytic domain-containing protein n=1 Tax=Talaromyces proteolyticus TaxID=1131652 RepID=A0AAD4Q6C8_9EURO|nr:uncharacterized protein BGW36DRAFT_393148 [Talaromyces proteolyticus]KAH8705566.1 hypothetical protein BGW36DRAFT_393148 [Talaromyces proteolyticus]
MDFTNAFVATMMATVVMAAPHGLDHRFSHLHARQNTTVNKLGAAYNDASLVSAITNAGWAYDWNLDSDGTLPSGVEYCPMLWGQKMYDQWQSSASSYLSSGSTCLLGFNEPDMTTQANMSPQQAATDYQTYMTPFANQATLVSPAVTNGVGDNLGLTWMESWLQACNGACGATVMAIHYYANTDTSDFYNFVNNAASLASQYGMSSVWITEFQNTGTSDQQVSFLQEVIPWLNNNTDVGRYAYFYVADQYLLSGTSLSAIGEAYTATY